MRFLNFLLLVAIFVLLLFNTHITLTGVNHPIHLDFVQDFPERQKPEPPVAPEPSVKFGRVIDVGKGDTFESVVSSSDIVVVVFGASWCAPCHSLRPDLEQIAADYSSVVIYYVDAEQRRDFVDSAGRVAYYPCIRFYNNSEFQSEMFGSRPAGIRETVKTMVGG
jgi:thioredoxin 1